MKTKLIKLATTLLLLIITGATTNASYINLGSLDIKLKDQNQEWLNTYLNKNTTQTKQIIISNYSNQQKELTLYTTDAETTKDKTFATKNTNDTNQIKNWITLDQTHLILNPNEQKIITATIKIPKNAGIGLHKGAIIAKELIPTENTNEKIGIEKGIRIYLNIKGEAIQKSQIINIKTNPSLSKYNLEITEKNTGTIDKKSTYTLQLKDIFTNEIIATTTTATIQTNQQKTTTLKIEKPKQGIYEISLKINNKQTILTTQIFIPFYAIYIFLALLLLITIQSYKNQRKTCQPLFTFDLKDALKDIKTSTQQRINPKTAKKVAIYISLLLIITTITTNINLNPKTIKTQLLPTSKTCQYSLTIKWGNLRNLPLKDKETKNWKGEINFPNAKIKLKNYINIEKTDKLEIKNKKQQLAYNITTNPDIDGITLDITPTQNKTPIVQYIDENKNIYEFKITDYLISGGTKANGKYETYFKTTYCTTEKQKQLIKKSTKLIKELPASEEKRIIPELQNLFIEDIPASKDKMSKFILNSSYISKKENEENTQKLKTSPLLINALSATPEILAEIAGSPDLNYIFIPESTITFPPIPFSFDNNKVTSKSIGTLIFVQNKNEPWNTYIKTTNFLKLTGDGIIPNTKIQINPGEPTILGEYKLDPKNNSPTFTNPTKKEITKLKSKLSTGKTHKFTNKYDKAQLITATPITDKKVIFILNPTITVEIPKGTAPGTYKGAITITSL